MNGIQHPSVLLCNFSVTLASSPAKVYLKSTILGNGTNHEENKQARDREEGVGAILDQVVRGGLSKEVTLERN